MTISNFCIDSELKELLSKLTSRSETYIGYPNSQLLDNKNLTPFLNLPINNVGDPFQGNNGMNTFEQELEVLKFFGDLLKLTQDELWGYVTNGGSEGNLFGIYLARETYPEGVLFFSEDSHYSLRKTAQLLKLKTCVVQSQNNGEMDYGHLDSVLRGLKHYPAIINANIGTTMKGAIDRIDKIYGILRKNQISKFHIHCDGALMGAMLPFINDAPQVNFSQPIDSISISGHKFLGSPIPSGVVLTRRKKVESIQRVIEYIGSIDSTVSGSRDGLSVLILWQVIKRLGTEGLRARVQSCLSVAEYALRELRKVAWPCWMNAFSNTVVLKRPADRVIKKWQLATEGNISHLIAMPGIDRKKIDQFIGDLVLLSPVKPITERALNYDERKIIHI